MLAAQQGPSGPAGSGGGSGGGPDPAVTAILNAIDANLADLGGTMTADFQCVDTSGNRTTTNGQLLAKGTDKLRMDFGSAGKLYVHDDREFNFSASEQPGMVTGLRWDDPIGTSVDGAVVSVGAIDLRGLLRLARQRESSLTRASTTETVNGVVCRKLETSDFALWVQEGASHRIVRARLCSMPTTSAPAISRIGLALRLAPANCLRPGPRITGRAARTIYGTGSTRFRTPRLESRSTIPGFRRSAYC